MNNIIFLIIHLNLKPRSLDNLPQSGRPQKTSLRVDKVIRRKSVDIRKTVREIAQELHDENLADLSPSLVQLHNASMK